MTNSTSTSTSTSIIWEDKDLINISMTASNSQVDKSTTAKSTKKEVLRPRTAYNFFYRHQRDLILNAQPQLISDNDDESRRKRPHRKTQGLIGLQQLTKTVAKKWKEVSPETRNKFKRLAEEDKVRYTQETMTCATETFVKPAVDIVPQDIISKDDGDDNDTLSQAKEALLNAYLPDKVDSCSSSGYNDLRNSSSNGQNHFESHKYNVFDYHALSYLSGSPSNVSSNICNYTDTFGIKWSAGELEALKLLSC